MPVMVKDDINGSFCQNYIGVSGKAARLNKTMDTFLDSVACISSPPVFKCLHMQFHTQFRNERVFKETRFN